MNTERSLEGCKAKVTRAKELIEQLENEILTILNSEDYKVVSGHEFEKKRYVFRLQGKPLPLKVSVLVGEIIHHLRSTLDHMVWMFANKDGLSERDCRNIYFPVCSSQKEFEKAVKKGKLVGVPENLKNFVESLQPYKSNDSKNSIIKILHDLDIIEKHKLLLVVSAATRMGSHLKIKGTNTSNISIIVASEPSADYPFFKATEDGVNVHWVNYETTTEPLWWIENDFSIRVEFQEIGSHEKAEVIPILWQLHKLIEEIFSLIKVPTEKEIYNVN